MIRRERSSSFEVRGSTARMPTDSNEKYDWRSSSKRLFALQLQICITRSGFCSLLLFRPNTDHPSLHLTAITLSASDCRISRGTQSLMLSKPIRIVPAQLHRDKPVYYSNVGDLIYIFVREIVVANLVSPLFVHSLDRRSALLSLAKIFSL